MMTVGVYFRIRDLITATLQENVMMAKCGRYYRSYEHIFRHNTHNCDGRVNLVFHSFSNIQCKHFAFQVLFHSLTGKSAPVSSSGQCKTQTHTADLRKNAYCMLPITRFALRALASSHAAKGPLSYRLAASDLLLMVSLA